ncbi:hypothetical protein [Clostridium sp. 'White wine YQ']|uniref:hypothetical protein n=1 Tax=Clostridium sp. 'White wine YQ' TaxID=3027474 RepID=UPI002367410F|nr:hypothetical protein [Clostridium sp. 'White wine YQ']MDD7792887.1 hypothetical protein [Clostridium sp. 'White wine YQ']
MDNKEKQIIYFIKKAGRRIKIQIVLNKVTKGLLVALVLSTLLCLISLFVPFYESVFLSLFFISASLIGGLIIALFYFPSIKEQGIILDSIGLEERASTALELIGRDEDYAIIQREDALECLKKIDIKKGLPLRVNKKLLLSIGVFLILFITFILVPTPAKGVAKDAHELEKKKSEVSKVLQEEKKKIEDNKELSKEDKKKLSEIIEKSKLEINKANNESELKKTLERIDKKLEQLEKEKDNNKIKNPLEELRNRLNPKAAEERSVNNKKDIEAIKDKLNSSEKTKDLAKAIENSNDQEVSKALNNLSNSLKSMGDLEKGEVSKALGDAANSVSDEDLKNLLNKASEEAMAGEISSTTKDQLNDALKEAKEGASVSNSQGNSNGESSSQGENGNGNNSGNNSGNGQGSGQGSGGAQGNGNGVGWNNGSKNGQEVDAAKGDEVYIPDRNSGNDENLTGQKNKSGNSQVQNSSDGVNERGESVDLDSVIGDYSKDAIDGLEGSSMPDYLKDIIKDYFEELGK